MTDVALANWQASFDDMPQLTVSNDLLGDRKALNTAWDRDGYWFFRDVLDKGAIARLRQVYLDELETGGWIEPGDGEARYTGKSLEGFPPRMEPLVARRPEPWRAFVREPAIDRFFQDVMGEPVFWVPNTDYRATPPTSAAAGENRFVTVHQDGFYNDGLAFRTCWAPLSVITPQIGGLSITEGQHRRGYLHDLSQPPAFPIPPSAIAPGDWRRADYRPGDVVIFDPSTTHAGWTNHSDRFRLSIDMRFMPASAERPMIGSLVSLTQDRIVMLSDEGETLEAPIDETTYCRGIDAMRVPHAKLASVFRPGDHLIVACGKDGVARNMRHSH